MENNLWIGLSGKKCSGKSFFANALASQFGLGIVRFGDFVRHLADLEKIEETVENLQELGQKKFDEMGANLFLNSAVEWAVGDITSRIIFDGVRHIATWDAIKSINRKGTSLLFYVDVEESERLRRWNLRSSTSLIKNQLANVDKHPVEKGSEELKKISNAILDGALLPEKNISLINHLLKID
jgi:dephospho-CoA kinase